MLPDMENLRALFAPLAALASVSERERKLLVPVEVAVLDTQCVSIKSMPGRKSARVRAAEEQALERSARYARHIQARQSRLADSPVEWEIELPFWMEPPEVGECFWADTGQAVECLEVMFVDDGADASDLRPHRVQVRAGNPELIDAPSPLLNS
ncbi:hypothetical protein [Deinococcus sp. UYEF24]